MTGLEHVRFADEELIKTQVLQGEAAQTIIRGENCSVYKMENETGEGVITRYPVFPGIELLYDDMVRLYEVTASEECPVCQSNLPPFSYCPSCGIPWSDSGKSVETLLSSMRQEAARNIRDPKASDASRLAWYWSHIGAIDLARQMGVITEERRQELYDEMRPLKPAYASGTENGDVVQ